MKVLQMTAEQLLFALDVWEFLTDVHYSEGTFELCGKTCGSPKGWRSNENPSRYPLDHVRTQLHRIHIRFEAFREYHENYHTYPQIGIRRDALQQFCRDNKDVIAGLKLVISREFFMDDEPETFKLFEAVVSGEITYAKLKPSTSKKLAHV